ncbi:MAG: M67 family metallopeptidase [Oscillospiraceae bacterium]|nr:M67 family metallopeptidase [Oscillospiraceae bacterium]
MVVTLPKEEYRKLLAHAQSCLPEEGCGLIAGKLTEHEKQIEKVYLLPNADHSPTHFTIAPQDQLNAILDMRKNGLAPLGNWHSHPETPSRPSEEDKRLAYDSSASYLILSLAKKEPVLRSFSITAESVEIEELVIKEEA